MQNQIDNLKSFYSVEDIYVVVGYKMHLIMETYPGLAFVYNQDFSTNNTSKSLLKALRKLVGEDVLWLNGDVVFDKALIEQINTPISSSRSFVCVNNAKVSDEEIKYTLDQKGFIKELSKQVVGGVGEAVGINFISKTDLPLFIEALDKVEDNDYFEKGLELIIGDGVEISPVDISQHFCMEVDFQEDLRKVNEQFQT